MFTPAGRLWIAGLAIASAVPLGLGCSNLTVRKVPVSERVAHTDKEKGFRYYLNRPYLVVKQPILVTETRSLVQVDPSQLSPNVLAKSASGKLSSTGVNEMQLTFLSGRRRGESVQLADLRVETPGSGEVRLVRPDELEKIGEVLATGYGKSSPPPTVVVPPPLPPSPPITASTEGMAVTTPGGAVTASVAPAAAVAASSALTADVSNTLPTPTVPQDAGPLQGKMDLIYLPDLDEQYVIKSHNVFAKSAIGLAFKNGCELTEVQGQHDATTLTVSIFQTIQSAIGTAQGVEQARIQQQARILQAHPSATGAVESALTRAAKGELLIFQLIERTWIKPGVYRLNKPWEVEDGAHVAPTGCGLLAKLGLPTVVDVDFVILNSLQISGAQK